MRLQWWICGRSVSVCLTLWCISTGLNPFSITSVSPSLSSSLHLFSLPFSRSLTLSDEVLSGLLPQFWKIQQHTDTSPSPTTKQQTGTELTICQLIFTGGSSEIVHLTFWPNGGECRTGDAALCQHLRYQSAPLETTLWFSRGYKYTDKGTPRRKMWILIPRVHKVSEQKCWLTEKKNAGALGEIFLFCVNLCSFIIL